MFKITGSYRKRGSIIPDLHLFLLRGLSINDFVTQKGEGSNQITVVAFQPVQLAQGSFLPKGLKVLPD